MRAVIVLMLTASIGCSAIVPKANGPSAASDLMLGVTAVATLFVTTCPEGDDGADDCAGPAWVLFVGLPGLVWAITGVAALVVSDWSDPAPAPATSGSRDPARPPSPP